MGANVDRGLAGRRRSAAMRWLTAATFLGGLASFASFGRAAEPALRPIATIPLPDVRGRIDHLAADVGRRRLFVAALSQGSVEVVDLAAARVVARIQGLAEPSGIVFAPDLDRLVVARSGSGDVAIHDATSLALVHRVALGPDADNVRYDEATKRAYVAFGAGWIAAIDVQSGAVTGRVELPAHPESFQIGAREIYVNLPGANAVAIVDRTAERVLRTWPLDTAHANYPMALDEPSQCLWVGCRRPPQLLAIATGSGAVKARLPAPGDCDDLFYDATSRLLYASCGAGEIGVYRRGEGCALQAVGTVATERGARTSLFVPAWQELFLAVPGSGTRAAEIRVYAAHGAPAG
jgi:hypothetical protein